MHHTVNTFRFSGQELKRRILSSVSDFEAYKAAGQDPQRFKLVEGSERPDMLKARRAASAERLGQVRLSDPWVRDILNKWCELSGLPEGEAQFWLESGFREALREGRDIHLQTYLDEDGWAWISTRDSPNHWLHRKRLPELTRQMFLKKLEQRGLVNKPKSRGADDKN